MESFEETPAKETVELLEKPQSLVSSSQASEKRAACEVDEPRWVMCVGMRGACQSLILQAGSGSHWKVLNSPLEVMRDPEDKKKLGLGFKRTPKTRTSEDQLYSHVDKGWNKNKLPLPQTRTSDKHSVN